MLHSKNRKKNLFNLILIFFLLILIKYFYVQIISYNYYKKRSGDNHIEIVETKPPRGIIYDRNKQELVSNRETFSIQIYPAYYNKIFDEDLFYQKIYSAKKRSEILVDQNQFKDSIRNSGKYQSITIVDYIDFETRALMNEYKLDFPGLIFYKNPARFYSDSLKLSHVLGYLRPIDTHDLKDGSYNLNDIKGKAGIEKEYEKKLRGKKGKKYHLVDTYGQDFGIDEESNNIEEIPGENLFLTIDYNLQLKVEQLLKGRRGAVICMNPKNGEILAIASAPDYSLKEFIGPLKTKIWNKWKEENILVNRALRGRYSPASIYKLVVGIMFLEEKQFPISEYIFCNGEYKLEDKSREEGFIIQRCWKEGGHGNVNLHDAIVQSCNIYFYDMILKYQNKNEYIIDILSKYANKFGFNKKTGVVLSEISGNIPDSDYMRKHDGRSWAKRGTMTNLVIGQGDNIVSPIQIINFINLIATKGKTFQPKLVLNEDSFPFELDISNYVWNDIQSAMYSVVNDAEGTAYMLNNNNANIYGKIGTQQLTALDKSAYSNQNSLFTGYIEKDQEMMSIIVVIENVDESSKSIAKLISKNIFDYYLSDYLINKGN